MKSGGDTTVIFNGLKFEQTSFEPGDPGTERKLAPLRWENILE